MPVIAVIGAQWGDEGKGKVVDLVAEKADVCGTLLRRAIMPVIPLSMNLVNSHCI